VKRSPLIIDRKHKLSSIRDEVQVCLPLDTKRFWYQRMNLKPLGVAGADRELESLDGFTFGLEPEGRQGRIYIGQLNLYMANDRVSPADAARNMCVSGRFRPPRLLRSISSSLERVFGV
jgi:hypothetical protein